MSYSCHSALSNAATYRKGFRAFSVKSCDLTCYLFTAKKKSVLNLVPFRFYGGFCSDILDRPAVYFISCFETSDSKTLPVKCNIQSDFDLLDFDIDKPRGLASLVLTKRNAASGDEIAERGEKVRSRRNRRGGGGA